MTNRLLITICLHLGISIASYGDAPSTNAAPGNAAAPDEQSTAINTAIVPVPKLELEDHAYDWYQRHQDELAAKAKMHPQVVLIGDSITHFWSGEPKSTIANGASSWKEAFGDLPVLNLGFGWDRTQNVLWRLDHGEFDGLTPKWVVILVGTNNIKGSPHARANSSEEIVDGIMAICDKVHAISPTSHVIVMAIFPRGASPTDSYRPLIAAVNTRLADTLKSHPAITYLDIGTQFLQPDGTLSGDIMPDSIHPNEKGYFIWAKALEDQGIQK